MFLHEIFEKMDEAPDGYSFHYNTVYQLWEGRYQTPTFTTVVEGQKLEMVIKELYSNVSQRLNNGLVVRLPRD